MIKYKIAGDCIKDTETGAVIPKDEGNRDYQTYLLWLDGKAPGAEPGEVVDLGTGPQEPEPEFSDEELAEQKKAAAIAEIVAIYEAAIAEPVECTDNDGNVYFMDGKRDSAAMMRDGIQLTELTGQTTMDITDYFNKTHAGITLGNCQTIMLQQAASFAAHRAKKCADREAVLYPEEAAESVEAESA